MGTKERIEAAFGGGGEDPAEKAHAAAFVDHGQPRDYRFGLFREGEAAVHLCLYGDEAKINSFAMEAACAQHPRDAGYATTMMLSLKIQFAKLRPYREVDDALSAARDRFNQEVGGYELVSGIEGLPWTASTVDGLKDTHDFSGNFTEEQEAWEMASCGYNAADGFCMVAEIPGSSPGWTVEEVERLISLAEKVASQLLGFEVRLEALN